jgi:hypothetical protein
MYIIVYYNLHVTDFLLYLKKNYLKKKTVRQNKLIVIGLYLHNANELY